MLKPTVHQTAADAIDGMAVCWLSRNGIGAMPKLPRKLFTSPLLSAVRTATKMRLMTDTESMLGR